MGPKVNFLTISQVILKLLWSADHILGAKVFVDIANIISEISNVIYHCISPMPIVLEIFPINTFYSRG